MIALSPKQQEDFIERLARVTSDDAQKEAGGAAGLVVMPIAAVTQMTGLTRNAIPKFLPVTRFGPTKSGVLLKHIIAYQEKNTTYPKGWKPEPAQP